MYMYKKKPKNTKWKLECWQNFPGHKHPRGVLPHEDKKVFKKNNTRKKVISCQVINYMIMAHNKHAMQTFDNKNFNYTP